MGTTPRTRVCTLRYRPILHHALHALDSAPILVVVALVYARQPCGKKHLFSSYSHSYWSGQGSLYRNNSRCPMATVVCEPIRRRVVRGDDAHLLVERYELLVVVLGDNRQAVQQRPPTQSATTTHGAPSMTALLSSLTLSSCLKHHRLQMPTTL